MENKETQKKLFYEIISFFPQYKDDESLSEGGDCFELPYVALSEIVINHIIKNNGNDALAFQSVSNLINHYWGSENTSENSSFFNYIIKDGILNHVLNNNHYLSKIQLNERASQEVDSYLSSFKK